MKTEPTSESVVASPIDDATAGRRILRRGRYRRRRVAALRRPGGLRGIGIDADHHGAADRGSSAAAAADPALRSGGGQRGEHRVHRGTGRILSRGHRSAGRRRYRLRLAGDGGYPGPGHGSGAAAVSAILHREVLAGRLEELAPGACRHVHAGERPEPDHRTARGLSLLPRARRSQDGQGRRQRRRPLPARRRRHARRPPSSARVRYGPPIRPRRPISAPARPPRSAIPSTRNFSTGSGRRRSSARATRPTMPDSISRH